MSKALKDINPRTDDLTKINDRGIKTLYQMYRQWRYNMVCGCCGETPYNTDEEVQLLEEEIDIIKIELDTRGHIPTAKERKEIRKRKAIKGRKR